RAGSSCAGLGFFNNAAKTAATFDVFFWLQVTNFDVSLFCSAPNSADHIDIDILVRHTHAALLKTYAVGQDNSALRRPISSKLLDATGEREAIHSGRLALRRSRSLNDEKA